jgi:hypothetical protein
MWNDSGTIFLSTSRIEPHLLSCMMAATFGELLVYASSRNMLQGASADDAHPLAFQSFGQ